MKIRLALIGMFMAPMAHAQFAVIDVASVGQLLQQAATLARQLEQAEAQVQQARSLYQSMTGPRGMEQLLSGSIRNYLPGNWQQLAASVQGAGSFSALNADIRASLGANSVLSATQLTALSPASSAQLVAARNNVALLQGLAQEALNNSSNRFGAIQQLIQAIPSATDQKGIMDLQARIGVEQGMLQNEQTKLETLRWVVSAQADALRLREQELAIASQGNFATRFEPIP
ncbi:MAG TPA: type IV secretion system protein [Steroidobacteraceae bacterium]|jgi:type IV secretion system protein VirB5|nr:type IV secretion system protein [Steroidobacteraceae bacterium]